MALARDYRETVVARIQRDRKFALALCAEAVGALLSGETAEGLSMLRDLVHAAITFKELARQTGLGEKTLHRMLLPGQRDRRQKLAENFGCRQGVSEERCPQWPLPGRTTPPTVKRTAKSVVYPAVRVVNRDGNPTARNLGLIVRSIADGLGVETTVQVARAG
jgi:DNA-binding phage protein